MADTKALAKVVTLTPVQGLAQKLNEKAMMRQILAALPKGLTPEKFVRTVITAAQRNPRIAECTQISLIGSVMEAAQLGFELDPALGHCALVPLKNKSKNVYECFMWPMYRGYISLAHRSNQVSSFFAKVVREGEEFQVLYGTNYQIHHVPKFPQSTDSKKWTGAYSVVIYKDGSRDFEYMDAESILNVRKRSPSVRAGMSSPWDTDPEPMWQKTVIRRHSKRLDLSPEDRRLQKAAALEELRDAGLIEKTGLGLDDYTAIEVQADVSDEAVRISEGETNDANGQHENQQSGAKDAANGAQAKSGSAKAATPKSKPGKPINATQVAALFSAAAEVAPNHDDTQALVKKCVVAAGFVKSAEVTSDRYDEIMLWIRNGGPPPEQH